MIRNRDFIVFSDDWGRHPFSCQHIMQHFLPENRILWVNTVGMRSPVLNFYDVKRSLEKIRSFLSRKRKTGDNLHNLWVSDPLMVPYSKLRIVRAINKFSVKRKIRSFIKANRFMNPITLTTVPNAVDYIKQFNDEMTIYYCIDDYTTSPILDSSLMEDMENRLLDLSDLVVASSKDLCIKKKRGTKQPLFLPHGVDFEHFQVSKGGIPEKIRHIPKPVIGFFGVISHWFDVELVKHLASSRPGWSFVLIGPADIDLCVFHGFDNIYLPGKVSYEDLPRYAAEFDVGIIPFVMNDFTASVNPIKLLEYLAGGLPVVTVDMPEVRAFSDVIHIANDCKGFMAGIERSLQETSPAVIENRKNIARKHSWASTAEKLSAIIGNELN